MYKITKTEKRYSRTDSGRSWRKNPDSETREEVSREHYNNYVDSCHFFNRLGWCHAYKAYTYAGYLPTHITTISPDRREKIVTVFDFELVRA